MKARLCQSCQICTFCCWFATSTASWSVGSFGMWLGWSSWNVAWSPFLNFKIPLSWNISNDLSFDLCSSHLWGLNNLFWIAGKEDIKILQQFLYWYIVHIIRFKRYKYTYYYKYLDKFMIVANYWLLWRKVKQLTDLAGLQVIGK